MTCVYLLGSLCLNILPVRTRSSLFLFTLLGSFGVKCSFTELPATHFLAGYSLYHVGKKLHKQARVPVIRRLANCADKLEKALVWCKWSLVLRQTCSALILWSVVERVRS